VTDTGWSPNHGAKEIGRSSSPTRSRSSDSKTGGHTLGDAAERRTGDYCILGTAQLHTLENCG